MKYKKSNVALYLHLFCKVPKGAGSFLLLKLMTYFFFTNDQLISFILTAYWIAIHACKNNVSTYILTFQILSHDVTSGSVITPCNKIYKQLVVYRLVRNVMTTIITLSKRWKNFDFKMILMPCVK